MNQQKKVTYSIIGLIIVMVIAVAQNDGLRAKIASIARYDNIIAQTLREQLFPQSLVSSSGQQAGALQKDQIVALTNKERQNEGLAILAGNAKLDAAAQQKLNDLFARQYFDHVSPDGHGPSWVADQAGYSYVVVGENLALGDFKDSAAVVAAWMASPGHKANILNSKFADIGVAVGRGTYEGKKVWIAVQEFGKPLSDCPAINTSLRTQIERDRATVEKLGDNLAAKRKELSSMPQSSPEAQEAYNKKVAEYNKEVAEYNTKSAELKSSIQKYNTQVQGFNACIKQ